MRDTRSRRELATAFVDITTGPAVAILFWITVGLIVLMTAAHGKFWDANFFEMFGAVGQVALAGAIFWLGVQQFRFTKELAARQHRVETYPIKADLARRFMEASDNIGKEGQSDRELLWVLLDETMVVFTDKVSDLLFEFVQLVEELEHDRSHLNSKKKLEDLQQTEQDIDNMVHEGFSLRADICDAMNKELSLNNV